MRSIHNLARRATRFPRVSFVVLFLATTSAGAQLARPTDSQLSDITARGRALAEYDFAAWHGSDAIAPLNPPAGSFTKYIARQTPKGWMVAFGKLTASRDTFLIAYEAIRTADSGEFEGFKGVAHSRPIVDTDYYVRASRALDTAVAEFGAVPHPRRPYNAAVMPTPGGDWWVYLFPAPTVAGVWPLGADARLLISADGRKVLERRRMHNDVIEFTGRSLRKPPGATLASGVHTAVVAEIPEDTDVYHVLTRTPRVPEYVMTDHFIYRIDTDGKINFLAVHTP